MKMRKELVAQWNKVKGGLTTRTISDFYIRENMAQILENQKYWGSNELFLEGADGNVSISNLDASTNVDWRFRPITMALQRRTFPDLFAHKVIPVQAMSTPVGLAYAIRYTYDKTGIGTEAGWDFPDYYSGYTGNQNGTSANLINALSGFADGSGLGANVSAADQWKLLQGCNPCSASNGEYPQLGVRFDQQAILAKDRRLGASFTIAAMQDIKAMQQVDIEREMIQHLQYEITAELDREIVTTLKYSATDTTTGGEIIAPVDMAATAATGGTDGRWAGEKFMAIIASIVYQANQIAIKTRRGPGNFVIVSNAVATAIQAAGHQFVKFDQNTNATTTNASIGKLNGALDVYRDQYARTDYALVGYKGPGISDGGIIFSPYVMGIVNSAVSQHDFSRIIGVMSRYAITKSLLGTGRYYRLIPFKNMGTVIPGAINL